MNAMDFEPDVLILGAGVAGLAAAMKLTGAGVKVWIIEARDRIGGRVHSIRELNEDRFGARAEGHAQNTAEKKKSLQNLDEVAIEFGAEFVHGQPPEIWDVVAGATEMVDELEGENWCVRDGRLHRCDFFDQVNDFLEHMKDCEQDQSFAEWAHSAAPDVPEQVRRHAFAYVEGFNAAHAEEISVQSLVRAAAAEEKINGDRAFRIRGGYSFIPRALLARCDPAFLRVSMNTIVDAVEWTHGQVQVRAGEQDWQAPRAIVTLPLGVLQSNAVAFRPPLTSKWEAHSKLAMGHVIRVTLRFRERFWDSLRPAGEAPDSDVTLAGLRFLFTDDPWFPTWWSTLPQRAPILVGWAPATAAERLSGKGEDFQIDRAVQSLAAQLQFPHQQLKGLLQRGYVHDWQADPFARGAYSYVKVGGSGAEGQLAAPLDETLYFAGEATDTNGYFGTVHGAIASGYRAANEILGR